MDNLIQRGGIDVARLFASIPRRPTAVFIVPWLVTGGAEKYMADMVGALKQDSHEVLVIVTLPKAKSAPGWPKLGILAPLREAQILFWSDVCRRSSEPYILARLLNALCPQLIFVVNSELGYEVVANFGRGLASLAKLFCAFFALGEIGLSDVRYGMYYPRHTLRFAKAVTDDLPTVNRLQALYGKIPGPGIAMLPPRLSIVHEKTFNDRLAARKRFAGIHPRRWAWVGRLTLMKGTAVLAALAGVRPEDRFEIFGSLEGSLESLEIRKPNIWYRGCLDNILEADFREYHGYVYTSLFDGMPNVVLEMSQHAIPLVLADIGGLRDTFDDESVIFVKQTHSDPKETALAFDEALHRLAQLSETHVDHMILKAYRQVRNRHSPETYTRILSEIIA
jgi:glycosyltransferase involved in cell wall biosynthesis